MKIFLALLGALVLGLGAIVVGSTGSAAEVGLLFTVIGAMIVVLSVVVEAEENVTKRLPAREAGDDESESA